MYEVTVTTTISAAHHLRGYRGKCENVHGHNYKVEATVRADDLDGIGLALDFGILRQRLDAVVNRFDHRDLNETEEFADLNPSGENLARVIYRLLAESIADLPVKMHQVSVRETDGSFVTFREGPA